MNRMFVRFFMAALMLMAATSLQAHAGEISEDDAQRVRGVIAEQLAAFAQDDADSAFATATPAVREAIGTPWRFLAMVRGVYPMVYRPASVTFHKPKVDDGTVVQLVEIKDGDDKSWLVLFALEKQPDASWRIGACAVAENTWKSI